MYDANGPADALRSQLRVTTTFDPCLTDDILTSALADVRAPLRIVLSASYVMINRVQDLALGLAIQADREALLAKVAKFCSQYPDQMTEWQGVISLAPSMLTDLEAENEPHVTATLDEAWSEMRLGVLDREPPMTHRDGNYRAGFADQSPFCGLKLPCFPSVPTDKAVSTIQEEPAQLLAASERLPSERLQTDRRQSRSRSIFTALRHPLALTDTLGRDSVRQGRYLSTLVPSQASVASIGSGSDNRRLSMRDGGSMAMPEMVTPSPLPEEEVASEEGRNLTTWEKICCMITSSSPEAQKTPFRLRTGSGLDRQQEVAPEQTIQTMVNSSEHVPFNTPIWPNPKQITRAHLATVSGESHSCFRGGNDLSLIAGPRRSAVLVRQPVWISFCDGEDLRSGLES